MPRRTRHTETRRLGHLRAMQSPLRGGPSPPPAHRRRTAESYIRTAVRRHGLVLEGNCTFASLRRFQEFGGTRFVRMAQRYAACEFLLAEPDILIPAPNFRRSE